MATRWGICSTGKIAHDFCLALRTLPSTEHEIVAVAGRQKESAEAFAKQFSIPTAYGSYEELAQDPNVEIVYVGTIHPMHFAACNMFMDHGKPILCEKPLTMSLQQTKDLLAKAKEKKLFFMEGFWTRFFPAVHRLQEVISSGQLGTVNILQANFCVPIAHVDRMAKKELGGGGLLDLGCYLVQYANLVFREMPESITAVGDITEEGVDSQGTLVLKYKGGSMAALCYSTNSAPGNNTVTVYGSKGNFKIETSLQCPTQVILPSGEKEEFPLPGSTEGYVFQNSLGFVYEANCVRECLKKGLLECPRVPHQDSIDVMTIMQEALNQMGVKY